MKTLRLSLLLGMLFTTFNLLAQSTPQKSFDVMKSLAGNWEGKTTMGDPVSVSYRLTSGGSALMSEIQTEMKGRSEDMITMIHLDGGRLLLTHYCAVGNQPRMQASTSEDGKTITFDFLDATNWRVPRQATCIASCSLSWMPTITRKRGSLVITAKKSSRILI